MDLSTKVEKLAGIGPAYVKRLEKVGINIISDFLFYFPRRYEDFSNITPIAQIKLGETVTVRGNILQIVNKKTARRGMIITEATVTDDSGMIQVVWFNQPFLIKNLKAGDEVALAGKLEWNWGQTSLQNPAYEKVSTKFGEKSLDQMKHVGRIVPVYSETEGLSSRWLRYKIQPLLKFVYSVKEYLPKEIRERRALVDLPVAIRQAHFPANNQELEKAKKRLVFDEIFLLQLFVLNKKKILKEEKAEAIRFNENLSKNFVQNLPFSLTDAQRKSAWEILQDIGKDVPMSRLLQGDVGSGKTVVAAFALLMTAKNSFQGVLMSPTEVLARQHFERVQKILEPFDIKIDLLVGSLKAKERKEILERVKKGETEILIGTHALLEEDIKFKNLALVIVDEQHRFGVKQRERLRKESGCKKTFPHFLSMTATPIPRTLTLTLYGDLDISVIDELPKGRREVTTEVVSKEGREKIYDFISKEVKRRRQVFVICPLIEESDKLGVKSVKEEYERLKKSVFSKFKIGLLHGKLKPKEKEKIMKDFHENKINILVSTSVIEVGIDIPNATVMMIEGSDRFGLAQLHQFRGRIGRGKHKSHCFLLTDSGNLTTIKRLNALARNNNGFKLAKIDLEYRGPGEIYGTKQHGIFDFKMANLLDSRLISQVREEANDFLKNNNLDDFPLLKEKVRDYEFVTHLE